MSLVNIRAMEQYNILSYSTPHLFVGSISHIRSDSNKHGTTNKCHNQSKHKKMPRLFTDILPTDVVDQLLFEPTVTLRKDLLVVS